MQPVPPKGNQSWIFTGRTDAEAEIPIRWPSDVKNWLIWKDPDAGKDWMQKGTAEDEMAAWHHRLDGRKSEWTPWVGDGQGGLACCNSWVHKESDTTAPLNWTYSWKIHLEFLFHVLILLIFSREFCVSLFQIFVEMWFYVLPILILCFLKNPFSHF